MSMLSTKSENVINNHVKLKNLHLLSNISNPHEAYLTHKAGARKHERSLFFGSGIQPKLRMDQANDSYEQEADLVTDKTMRKKVDENSDQPIFKSHTMTMQRKCAHCEEEEKKLQREEKNDKAMRKSGSIQSSSFFKPVLKHIQRKEAAEEKKIQREPDRKSPLKPMIDWDDSPKPDIFPAEVLERIAFGRSFRNAGNASGLTSFPSRDNGIMPNYREAILELIGRGVINPADYLADYANLFQQDYKLSAGLGLGSAVQNLYDAGKLDPLVGTFINGLGLDNPVTPGMDPDQFVAGKMGVFGVGSAVDRDHPSFNDGSGFTLTKNLIDFTFDENNIVRKLGSVADVFQRLSNMKITVEPGLL